ncbi:uncharacterized protein HaLaN_26015, partial [Haematococcus lacustris]
LWCCHHDYIPPLGIQQDNVAPSTLAPQARRPHSKMTVLDEWLAQHLHVPHISNPFHRRSDICRKLTARQQHILTKPKGAWSGMEKLTKLKNAPTGECRRIMLWMFWTLNMSYTDLQIAFENTAWRAPIAASILGGLMVLTFNIMSCVVLIRWVIHFVHCNSLMPCAVVPCITVDIMQTIVHRKSINRSGPSFGYGFVMAWCFVMAFFTFLCGLVLDSFGGWAQGTSRPSCLACKQPCHDQQWPAVDLCVQRHASYRLIDDGANWCGHHVKSVSTCVCVQAMLSKSTWRKRLTGRLIGRVPTTVGTVALAFICSAMYMKFFLGMIIFQGGISKTIGLYDVKTDQKRKVELGVARQNHVAPASDI